MAPNLVICSDGTGNTFAQRASNVSALVRALDLSPAARQTAVYDQGLGTNPHLVRDVRAFRDQGEVARSGLIIPDAPRRDVPGPLARLLGLSAGYGLRGNVGQLYRELARHLVAPDTRLFLFGFSRGAFTVRVLAGLVHRCGVPPVEIARCDACFARHFADAWRLYCPHDADDYALAKLKGIDGWRPDVEVHFLGLWDTVKSYGGVMPVSLPHLRHNPSVRRVCHALALHERRSWFQPTTWGGIDSDMDIQRPVPPDSRYAAQVVQEVGFSGCHSDIGGSDEPDSTAQITLRWMLGEATDHDDGLRLGPDAPPWLFEPSRDPAPVTHESFNAGWRASDRVPRWELENIRRPPIRPFRWRGDGARDHTKWRRRGVATLHQSTGATPGPGTSVVGTKRPRRLTVG